MFSKQTDSFHKMLSCLYHFSGQRQMLCHTSRLSFFYRVETVCIKDTQKFCNLTACIMLFLLKKTQSVPEFMQQTDIVTHSIISMLTVFDMWCLIINDTAIAGCDQIQPPVMHKGILRQFFYSHLTQCPIKDSCTAGYNIFDQCIAKPCTHHRPLDLGVQFF